MCEVDHTKESRDRRKELMVALDAYINKRVQDAIKVHESKEKPAELNIVIQALRKHLSVLLRGRMIPRHEANDMMAEIEQHVRIE